MTITKTMLNRWGVRWGVWGDFERELFNRLWPDGMPINKGSVALLRRCKFNIPWLLSTCSLYFLKELDLFGIDLNARDYLWETAVFYSAGDGKVERLKLLIDLGARVDIAHCNGDTPLHASVYYGNTSCVKILINADADVNAKNKRGRTPLDLVIDSPLYDGPMYKTIQKHLIKAGGVRGSEI